MVPNLIIGLNRIFSIALFIHLSLTCLGQSYFSKVYLHNNTNGISSLIIDDEDRFVLSTNTGLNNIEVGGILILDTLGNVVSEHFIDVVDSAGKGLTLGDSIHYFSGNDKVNLNEYIRFGALDKDFDTLWTKRYQFDGLSVFGHGQILIDSFFYLLSSDNLSLNSPGPKEANVIKLDLTGNEIWSRNYGQNAYLTTPQEIREYEGSLFFSSNFWSDIGTLKSGAITKIDTAGNVIWKTRLDSIFYGGTTTNFSLLNNGNIVASYKKDFWDDPLWDNYIYPPTLYFLDQDGQIYKDKILVSDDLHELSISEIIQGNGNYFFIVGISWDWKKHSDGERGLFGWLMKMDYDGNIIWEREFQEELYPLASHNILSLIERPNGDLVMVGNIVKGQQLIWVMKLDQNGCLDPENCEGQTILTNTENISMLDTDQELHVFPNPADDYIKIRSSENLLEVSIVNVSGKLMSKTLIDIPIEDYILKIKELPSGVYHVVASLKNGKRRYSRFVKI